MILPITKTVGVLYRGVIKPILFLQSPDRVHAHTIKLGALVGRVPTVAGITRNSLRYDQSDSLSQTIDKVHFPNPIGLAAGLDKNAELLPLLPAIGFGFSTIGSVTHLPSVGNPKPWYFRLPKYKSLVVNNGLANEGTLDVLSRIAKMKPASIKHHTIVLSVAKTNTAEVVTDDAGIDDYISSLLMLHDNANISVAEINISCPNAYGGEPFTDARRLEKLLTAVDALEIRQPIWIKMPINLEWDDFRSLLDIILVHNVQGVTIGNLNKSRESLTPGDLPDTVKGNLSGLPTRELSDTLITQTYGYCRDKLMIIGVGGIFSAEDAYRKICLGANLVELITGVIYEGPQLIGQMNRDLERLLDRDGFENVSDAVGSEFRKKR